jgi:glutathione S-transferase
LADTLIERGGAPIVRPVDHRRHGRLVMAKKAAKKAVKARVKGAAKVRAGARSKAAKGTVPNSKAKLKTATARRGPKPILYGHFLSTPSIKVATMLAMAGVEHEYRHVDLMKGAHKASDFLEINRFGQVPALVDGKLKLCQSNAILEYLAEKTGKFGMGNVEQRQRIREWLAWEADILGPGISGTRAHVVFFKSPPDVVQVFTQRGKRALDTLEATLAHSKFLAGPKPTIADIACAVHVSFAHQAQISLEPYPLVRAWAERVAALKGWTPPELALARPT